MAKNFIWSLSGWIVNFTKYVEARITLKWRRHLDMHGDALQWLAGSKRLKINTQKLLLKWDGDALHSYRPYIFGESVTRPERIIHMAFQRVTCTALLLLVLISMAASRWVWEAERMDGLADVGKRSCGRTGDSCHSSDDCCCSHSAICSSYGGRKTCFIHSGDRRYC